MYAETLQLHSLPGTDQCLHCVRYILKSITCREDDVHPRDIYGYDWNARSSVWLDVLQIPATLLEQQQDAFDYARANPGVLPHNMTVL